MKSTNNTMANNQLTEFDGQRNKNNTTVVAEERKFIPAWKPIIVLLYVHIGTVFGIYSMFTSAHYLTIVTLYVCHMLGCLGITAGAHRLWSHRAYKANLPLRIILMTLCTLSYQYNIIYWVRHHRLHHKHSDTPADPHNISYGFMYAHIGWTIRKKSRVVVEEMKKLDLSDLYDDPVLQFQEKYWAVLVLLITVVLPTIIPMYFWGESFSNAFFVNTARYCLSMHVTFLVNSLAHYIGGRPYNEKIKPRENKLVSFFAFGEGFHNYHHTFPWDYKTAELGDYSLNPSTAFIDLFAKIGWAYDLKTISEEMIRNRSLRNASVHQPTFGLREKEFAIFKNENNLNNESIKIK